VGRGYQRHCTQPVRLARRTNCAAPGKIRPRTISCSLVRIDRKSLPLGTARLDAAHRQHSRRADAGSGGCLSSASLAQPDQYQHSRARSGDHLRQYRAAHQSRDAFFIVRGLELSRVRLAVGQAARESEKRKERCAGQYPHRLSPSSFAVISVGEYSSERGSQKKRAAARRPSIHEKRVAPSTI